MTTDRRPQASIDPTTLADDLVAEGESEEEFNPGIAGRLPKKNVAAGALIRDSVNRILFVVPTYKPFLEVPDGLAEDDDGNTIYSEFGQLL